MASYFHQSQSEGLDSPILAQRWPDWHVELGAQ